MTAERIALGTFSLMSDGTVEVHDCTLLSTFQADSIRESLRTIETLLNAHDVSVCAHTISTPGCNCCAHREALDGDAAAHWPSPSTAAPATIPPPAVVAGGGIHLGSVVLGESGFNVGTVK